MRDIVGAREFIPFFRLVDQAKKKSAIVQEGVERGRRFEALLITEHGKPHQKLIGIVTPIDIMKVD